MSIKISSVSRYMRCNPEAAAAGIIYTALINDCVFADEGETCRNETVEDQEWSPVGLQTLN